MLKYKQFGEVINRWSQGCTSFGRVWSSSPSLCFFSFLWTVRKLYPTHNPPLQTGKNWVVTKEVAGRGVSSGFSSLSQEALNHWPILSSHEVAKEMAFLFDHQEWCIPCASFVYRLKLYCLLIAQSCLTLCDAMDCSLPGSSVHGILWARTLECVAISSSRGSSQPKDRT